MKKIVLMAFNGELGCFSHVLLNALDMQERQWDVKIVIEGAATKLIKELTDPGTPFAALYTKVKAKGLIDSICRACAAKMGTLESAEKQGLRIDGEMNGHPSIAAWLEKGYEVMTF
jgi:hypothetical protein